MGIIVSSRLGSDLDEQERNTGGRQGLCVWLRTWAERPFYKPLSFRAQDSMINGAGGTGGRGEITVGVQITQKR